MSILEIKLGSTGLVDVKPRVDYLLTDNTVAEILIAGYLNHAVDQGYFFTQGDLVCVVTKSSPTARQDSGIYQVDHNGANWNLIPTTSSLLLTAAQYTTAGGGAGEAITITGLATTDLAFVQMVDDGTNNVTIIDAVATANTLTITFSGDPGNDAIVNYQILRP